MRAFERPPGTAATDVQRQLPGARARPKIDTIQAYEEHRDEEVQ